MGKHVKVVYKKNGAIGWGIFLLLVAALVLSNQFGGFVELGIWSILVSALAVAFLVQCIINRSFASLPIPIAALYYIYQAPLGEALQIELPQVPFWPLALATVLATIGLHVLLPNRWFRKNWWHSHGYDRHKDKYRRTCGGGSIAEEIIVDIEDAVGEVAGDIEDAFEGAENRDEYRDGGHIEEGGDENNPSISVQFGAVSRYLHAESLETVELNCRFGSLEVYFNHVQLSPKGAEAFVNCQFGATEIYVPSHWHVIDNMSASLAGVDIKRRRDTPDENAPQLKITGNVSLGAVEVHRI